MKHQVLSVYDSKAKAFAQPFFTANREIALRAFAAAVNDRELLVGKFPQDYTLYLLGEFDDELGGINMLPQPENLGLAANFKTE
ncbi:MAG: nonstructural protein [Microviridae sp.]|nr:MAG: nonstructural protein [Microviridae sp.]